MLPTNLCIGHAAEFLVCYDLALRGMHVAPNVFEHCPYDVLAETGSRLLRIQVKGTAGPQVKKVTENPVYIYELHGNGYDVALVDLIALVAVDLKTIVYYRPGDLGKSNKRITVDRMKTGCDKALLEVVS